MKPLIFIQIVMTFSITSTFGQKTQFVNHADVEVDSSIADFYRIIYMDSVINNNVLIKKYEMNNTIVSSGYYLIDNLKTKNGEYLHYSSEGDLNYQKNYAEDKLDGKLVGYYNTGEIRRIDEYSNDSLVSGKCFTKSGLDTTYYPMIVRPTFKFRKHRDVRYFVAQILCYPPLAAEQNISGDVYVSFSVNSNGDVCDIEIESSPDKSLNKESMSVIKRSSKYWEAGYIEGKKANFSFTFPIRYRLD